MDAKNAMIVWNRVEPGAAKAEVVVYHQREPGAYSRYRHLRKSLGACCSGWCVADPAADLFRVFLIVVSDGVPIEDAHREFLQIDEYIAVCDQRQLFGVPFPQVEGV
jgi:hypothetical protein